MRPGSTFALAALLALVLLAGLGLLAPSRPSLADLPRDVFTASGLWHIAIFAALGLVAPFVFPRVPRIILFEALLLVAGAAELAQYLVPGRDPSWADLVANGLGSLAALVPLPRRRPG